MDITHKLLLYGPVGSTVRLSFLDLCASFLFRCLAYLHLCLLVVVC